MKKIDGDGFILLFPNLELLQQWITLDLYKT